jgi:uncharacterized membrane protein YoaK (UPF0700 family)
MPINYLRSLTSLQRTETSNRRLGCALAFVAGAANAGGFIAIGQYTSHMSGIVSSVADNAVLGRTALVFQAFGAVLAFAGGAATSAILINWGRQRCFQSVYAIPLVIEALVLLFFGVLGPDLLRHQFVYLPPTVALLCYVMGLQNAMITKISKAEIRTTHVTGLITDIGIELGRALYWNGDMLATDARFVRANRPKVILLTSLLLMFVAGGFFGAATFERLGFLATVPIAFVLLLCAFVPLLDDIAVIGKQRRD